jgi:hypothetical protein
MAKRCIFILLPYSPLVLLNLVKDKGTVQVYCTLWIVVLSVGAGGGGGNPRAEPWNEGGGPRGGSTKSIGVELNLLDPLFMYRYPLLFFRLMEPTTAKSCAV